MLGALLPVGAMARPSAGREPISKGAVIDVAPTMAITFDDIPAHGPLPPGIDRLAVIDGIIAALRTHGVTTAHGFFNAGFGAGDPQAPDVVAHWRQAGFPLGNHSFSHLDLDQSGPAAFLADVVRNEPPLAQAMPGADWHWLRYPFLHEGRTAADQDAVRKDLRHRGYRIAAVTMSFGDFGWNAPYARCAARQDKTEIAELERTYLAAASSAARRARTLSRLLYGRDIPYVLLMHVGAFDARMLPRLLDLYQSMGFRFVTLAQAERDPFYAAARNLSRPGPSPTLESAARSRGISVPALPPLPPATTCS